MGVEMVDITGKKEVYREAEAQGLIILKPETVSAIKEGKIPKGDVISAAQLAAINAVKKTPDLILLAHPIASITSIDVKLKVAENGVKATVTVKSVAKTGVELEALVGVTTALLTIFDMCKQFEKDENGQYPLTRITDIRVTRKKKMEREE
ncbi:MAG: cyclic pyranopterin monophosphate synthase MoaC [Candidatus Bathyarchaeia archaeon]|nr:cyclic pyranopterin monophosphate synthase MoaC [Candidatus Bathyarchaeota archaeon]